MGLLYVGVVEDFWLGLLWVGESNFLSHKKGVGWGYLCSLCIMWGLGSVGTLYGCVLKAMMSSLY